jgi:tetratricopeptide (TPR) repeat protein
MSHSGEDPKMAFNRGEFAEKKEDFKGAIEDYSNAIANKPDYLDAFIKRSYCFTLDKQFEKAIDDLEKANELGAPKDLVKSRIGSVYRESGNYERALEYQDQAIIINPNNAENYFNRATTKVAAGKIEGAQFDFDKCITIQVDYWDALYPYFQLKMSLNNFVEAIKLADKMIELKPKNASLYYNRGIAEFNNGDKISSKTDFLKAKSLGLAQADTMLNQLFKDENQKMDNPETPQKKDGVSNKKWINFKTKQGELEIEIDKLDNKPFIGDRVRLNKFDAPNAKYKIGFLNNITVNKNKVYKITWF